MSRARIHAALDELLDALDEYRRAPVEEDMILVRGLPFEAKARADLVRSGKLRTVRLGRQLWTKRSWVAAAMEMLPIAHAPEADNDQERDEPEGDELLEAARRRAARRAGP